MRPRSNKTESMQVDISKSVAHLMLQRLKSFLSNRPLHFIILMLNDPVVSADVTWTPDTGHQFL